MESRPHSRARRRRRRVHRKRIDDTLLIGVCERFLAGQKVEAIAAWLKKQDPSLDVGRQRIYRLVGLARDRRLLRLQVGDETQRGEDLARAIGVPHDRVHVVAARGEGAVDQVALRGAEVALELVHDLARRRGDPGSRVRVGLGGGRTMQRLSRELALLARDQTLRPALAVHALSSGFDPRAPQNAPITFLGAFDGVAEELVGLFSSGMLSAEEYEAARRAPGTGESFAMAREIDLVITSLASADDPAGALHAFLRHGRHPHLDEGRRSLEAAGWVGDVLYEPYSREGPLEAGLPVRTVSVFTLTDLVRRAALPDRPVLLVAGPSASGRSKAGALVPLLTRPALKLWTHLVLDVETTQEVLERLQEREAPRGR